VVFAIYVFRIPKPFLIEFITRSRALGVSEAELVRRVLDDLLLEGEGGTRLAGAGATEALEGFLEEADQLAEAHHFPEDYSFDREELYEDRV